MILAPSSSCCFCWNVVSQPSVSPLCDLINECWATRLDPLWGGHIWTLYIEIHIWLALSFHLFCCLALWMLFPFFVFLFECYPLLFAHIFHLFLSLSSSFCCYCPSTHPVPLMSFFPFAVLYLSLYFLPFVSLSSSTPLTPSLLHGDQALLSPSQPQELLTSAGCGAKVVPLSLPAGSGSLCSECLNMWEERRRWEDKNDGMVTIINKIYHKPKQCVSHILYQKLSQLHWLNEDHNVQAKALKS